MIEDRFAYYCKLTDPIPAAILVLAETMNAAALNETLTVEQAAERLGVHVATIRRAVKNRSLRHQRVGRSIRIQAADLAALNSEKPQRKFRCLKLAQ